MWSILWLTFILTELGSWCAKIPEVPLVPDAVAYLPQPLPQEQPWKVTPCPMGTQGGEAKSCSCSSELLQLASGQAAQSCPWLGLCSSGMSLNRQGSGLSLSWLGFY